MGDFRQTLPVIPKANRAQIVNATFKKSLLWGEFAEYKLAENKKTEDLNDKVMSRMAGEEHVLLSADSTAPGDDAGFLYPAECLNTLTMPGLPLHELRVETGAVVMLLRNLDQGSGLCNGTRLIVTAVHANILECMIIKGDFLGNRVMIPRITLQPSDSRFPFTLRRRQFRLRVALAMTMNKSQGQSLERVGIFLPRPVFSHGQLYVAYRATGTRPSS